MPREKDFDQKKAIDICTRLFADNGYSATGIQQIVEATGINRSSLYSTFKGKEELFHTCLSSAVEAYRKNSEMLKEKFSHAEEFVGAFVESGGRNTAHQSLIMTAIAEISQLPVACKNLLKEHHQYRLSTFTEVIRHGQKNTRISKRLEADELATVMVYLSYGKDILPGIFQEKTARKFSGSVSKLIEKKKG